MKSIRRLETGRPRRRRLPVKPAHLAPPNDNGGTVPDSAHLFYDTAPIGFYTLDQRGRIREVNEKGASLLSFPVNWLIDRPFVVFVANKYVHAFLALLTDSVRDLQPRSITLDLFIAKESVPVRIAVATSVDGDQVLHRLTVIDLTDAHNTEELLQRSLSNWSSLVQNAPEVIMTVEQSGRIAFVNRSVWGYSTTALAGTGILDHIPEAEHAKVRGCLEKAFRYNRRSTCEVRGISGYAESWYHLSFGSSYGRSPLAHVGQKATTTLVIREISEHKRTEQSLRSSSEQFRGVAARLDAVREEERTRVAREIHDELGQALTVLKLDLSWLQSKPRGAVETRKKLKAIIGQVDDTIERVRRIASELRPSVLDNLGLIPALEWQAAEFRKHTGIRVRLASSVNGMRIPEGASIAIFRVLQEALTNVMRHAKASKVEICLSHANSVLKVSISDNGIGMMQRPESDLKSLGIIGMKERIARIGGEFNFFSEPGRGTRLEIIIPVSQ